MISKTLAGAAIAFAAGAATANPLYIAYDNFNYSGTVTRYTTLADAQAATNAISSTAISTATNGPLSTLPNARDGQIYVAASAAGYDPTNLAYFSTAWYYSTTPANGAGWGNPNNTNPGFIQYYDSTANPVVSGGWSAANTKFTVDISGGDGDSGNFARLWAAPSSGSQAGLFAEFDFHLEADFGAAAVLNGSTGWYDTTSMPTALTGSASGIFQNNSVSDPSLNGFYAFDFTLAAGSWAAANGATYAGSGPIAMFAAPGAAAIPEPSSVLLAGLALFALGAAKRRR